MIIKNQEYTKCRVEVRDSLIKNVSIEMPSSYLDVEYLASEAIRQLREICLMDDLSSISRFNILHNKYFLNNDYEDPGFNLDWTMLQMLIPSASMSISKIEEYMNKLKDDK